LSEDAQPTARLNFKLDRQTWMLREKSSEKNKDDKPEGRNKSPSVLEGIDDDEDDEGDDDGRVHDQREEPELH